MRIFAGGVVGRYFEPDHVNSVLRLLRRPEIARYSPRFNDALLCRARSRNATEFLLDTDADVYLSIDSDIVFDDRDAVTICKAALELGGIVGGQYVTRTRGKYCFPTTLVADDQTVTYADDHTPVRAKYVSGGFYAAPRTLFSRLAEGLELLHQKDANMRFYPFHTPLVVDGDGERIYLSEDWALCERARDAGFGVWLDPAVRLLHLGQHPFRLEDMLVGQPPVQPLALTRRASGRYDIDTFAATAA